MKAVGLLVVLGALSAAGEVFHTKVGGTVTLQCGLGIKEVPMVKWYHKDNQIVGTLKNGQTVKGESSMKERIKLKDSSTLEISTVKEEDAGEFTCETVKHTLLVVSVSTTPSGPVQKGSRVDLGCEVKGVEPTPTVQWKRPNGKLQVSSKLESVALSDAGKWMCVFSYGGKEYTDSIQIEVKEPTPSTTTPSATQTSKSASGPSQPKSVNVKDFLTKWWKWITAGVCCLLLVIIVIASIFFKRIKRKKKLQMLRTGRQSLRAKKYCQCDQPTAARKPQQGRRKGNPPALIL
ncbi:CD4-2 molecule, tandem duplicate 2 isoform X2 [Echeneis naucrates]|uniref:CD4-2 molecule, tandem duplicate 2 isoform X2 n=1 Tax=Echeneis naucrates TaxID=173247 RepID=UPI001113B801|nr:hemicentin-1-like isoform X2 [Echeneis naucrates]